MVRPSEEEALKAAYKYQNILAFEEDFWRWLTTFQAIGRKKIKSSIKGK